jgi:hypothetical protein
MAGMTATYSHGGPAWDYKLQKAVTLVDNAFKCPMDCPMNDQRPWWWALTI